MPLSIIFFITIGRRTSIVTSINIISGASTAYTLYLPTHGNNLLSINSSDFHIFIYHFSEGLSTVWVKSKRFNRAVNRLEPDYFPGQNFIKLGFVVNVIVVVIQ